MNIEGIVWILAGTGCLFLVAMGAHAEIRDRFLEKDKKKPKAQKGWNLW